MKEDFKDILRKQLQDFESQDIPAGLWEGIEEGLDAPRRVVPLWRRFGRRFQVAASVLLLVGLGLGVWVFGTSTFDKLPDQGDLSLRPGEVAGVSEDAVPGLEEEMVIPEERLVVDARQTKPVWPVERIRSRTTLAQADATYNENEDENENGALQIALNQSKGNDDDNESLASLRNQETESLEPMPGRDALSLHPSSSLENRQKIRGSRFSVQLSAAQVPQGTRGNMLGYLALCEAGLPTDRPVFQTRGRTMSEMEYLAFSNAGKDLQPLTNTTYAQPVQVGLSMGYALGERWGLNAGLVYTRLKSTLTSGSGQSFFTNDQRLDYLGVPVSLTYSFLRHRNLRLYASGGGMVEFGVGGNVDVAVVVNSQLISQDSYRLHDLPVQFSVLGSAGAEYSFFKGLGLFAEPGISYHFRDHSDISSIYKAHPLNFNLQLGLRWRIE